MNWTKIGTDAYMRKIAHGFVHVMRVGNVWVVTVNGRLHGNASDLSSAQQIAEMIR